MGEETSEFASAVSSGSLNLKSTGIVGGSLKGHYNSLKTDEEYLMETSFHVFPVKGTVRFKCMFCEQSNRDSIMRAGHSEANICFKCIDQLNSIKNMSSLSKDADLDTSAPLMSGYATTGN